MEINLALLDTGPMPSSNLSLKDKKTILETARHAIQYGLTYQQKPVLTLDSYKQSLIEQRATFVTLKESGNLRGCIGSLKANQSLIQDVADHAYAAAFNDMRFPPITTREEPAIHISVSVLSSPSKVKFKSESDLLSQLVPGQDGIILTYRSIRSTFLPSVWEELNSPQAFMAHLKQKAGLAKDFWSSHISIERYYTDTIE